MKAFHHITVASYTDDSGKKRVGIWAARKPFSKGGKAELICVAIGRNMPSLVDAKHILNGVTIEHSIAWQRSAAVAAEARRADVVQVGHAMSVVGENVNRDGLPDYTPAPHNRADAPVSSFRFLMAVMGDPLMPLPSVDLVKQTIGAPPSVVTVQMDSRSNAEIFESALAAGRAKRGAVRTMGDSTFQRLADDDRKAVVQTEAIATADAHLNNAALPTYSQLRAIVADLLRVEELNYDCPHAENTALVVERARNIIKGA